MRSSSRGSVDESLFGNRKPTVIPPSAAVLNLSDLEHIRGLQKKPVPAKVQMSKEARDADRMRRANERAANWPK
ncbi:hypothetical protein KIPB_012636, partial [Kipferlia bialata]|eukprot:g12636.t1